MKLDTNTIQSPVVSVIVPAFNCELYIEAAVRSVMGQTFENWELIVIDDGSTDSTFDIVHRLAQEDCRIKAVKNPRNMGVAATRNRGFELSQGHYIALLDGDDRWYPDKLNKQLQVAEETNADLVYCSYGIIDEFDTRLCNDFIVPYTTDYQQMLVKSVISCSTVLLSRHIIEQYRFEANYYHEDLVYWLNIMRDEKKAYGAVDVLADYRVLHGSRASNKIKSVFQRWKIYRGYLKIPFFQSIILIMRYALLALKKYKRLAHRRRCGSAGKRNQ